MILTRLGNKRKIAHDIIKYFPQHNAYIDLFFGAGGIFFSKPLANYNFCNDLDDEVYNLFTVMADKDQCNELERLLTLMPIHQTLFKTWIKNKETEPIRKALRFLLLSCFSFLGCGTTLRIGYDNTKEMLLKNIPITHKKLQKVYFLNCDFRKAVSQITIRKGNERENPFIYADPPYLGTEDNYSHSFKENDTIDLVETLVNTKLRFAMSEFDNDTVLELAKTHNLQIINIGERQNIINRRKEILLVNYSTPQLTMF